MFRIRTYNHISPRGLDRLPRSRFEVGADLGHPDAILLRSADLLQLDIPASVKAIGRAGTGTSNIPVAALTRRGVPVFNAPGANANAVKELVLAGMLIAARNLVPALDFVRKIDGDDRALHDTIEAGKKRFVGMELPGRVLGVIGLGAIGVKVANAAIELGMEVWGYDPAMTVQNAWQLDARVQQAASVEQVLSRAQFLSLHVPLTESTRELLNADRLRQLPARAVLLNFSREGIVDDAAVVEALNEGRLLAYVSDFPKTVLKGHPRVVALPHLGASTDEAEEHCAVMVAEQLREFLDTGNVSRSVNFPEALLPLLPGKHRLCIVNQNVPNMVGQISSALARSHLNIADLLNKSRGDLAYTLVDVDTAIPGAVLAEIAAIPGLISLRVIAAR